MTREVLVEGWMNSLLGYGNSGSRCLPTIGKWLLDCIKEMSVFWWALTSCVWLHLALYSDGKKFGDTEVKWKLNICSHYWLLAYVPLFASILIFFVLILTLKKSRTRWDCRHAPLPPGCKFFKKWIKYQVLLTWPIIWYLYTTATMWHVCLDNMILFLGFS